MTSLHDLVAQTGGAPGVGRVVIVPGQGPRRLSALDLTTVVGRICKSIGVLQVAVIDGDMRSLMLAKMVQQHLNAAQTLVLPEDIAIQRLSRQNFYTYRSLLSGITPDNHTIVLAGIRALPKVDGTLGQVPAGDRDAKQACEGSSWSTGDVQIRAMVQTLVEELTATMQLDKGLVPECLGAELGQTQGVLALGGLHMVQPRVLRLGAPPEWACSIRDECTALRWDSAEVIFHVGVNGVVTLGIIDSGSFTSLVRCHMATCLLMSAGTACTLLYTLHILNRSHRTIQLIQFGDKSFLTLSLE